MFTYFYEYWKNLNKLTIAICPLSTDIYQASYRDSDSATIAQH